MTKLCKYCKKYPVFSHDYCRAHQWMRTDDKYLKYKELKKAGRIPKKQISKESGRRKIEHKTYLQEVKDHWQKSVEDETNFCIFCGEKSETMLVNHHWRGRTGKYYLDVAYWSWAHNDCHNDFHFLPVSLLMKKPWYVEFMARLSVKDKFSYYKQKKREEKAQLDLEM